MQNDMKDFDPDLDSGDVPSPCINVCKMHPETGLCDGCSRTIGEIALWSQATNEAKRAIWKQIRQRRGGHDHG
ncbi:MAG: uncharacterized protein V7606_2484 [Burkholderiales bacterium]|jgi:predicted Fe-S protein YdhL (DUF1289 family)|nr:hypothetical protein [Burkholderia sp.]